MFGTARKGRWAGARRLRVIVLGALSVAGLGGGELGARATGRVRGSPPARDGLAGRLAREAEAWADSTGFSGVVLVQQGARVVYEGAFGRADRATQAPITMATRFRLASITKQFVAALVLQEVAAGRMTLDAPIGRYLPAAPSPARAATVRQLLQHSSGLAVLDDATGFYVDTTVTPRAMDAVIARYANRTPIGGAGATFSYNNLDFLLLGRALERVTGRPFERLLTERLLTPFGLTQSGLHTDERVVRGLARGYVIDSAGVRGEDAYRISNFWASGAMYGTAGDVARWQRALLTDRVLPRAWRDTMFAPSRALGFVALGSWAWDATPIAGGRTWRVVERQGDIGAYNAVTMLVPAADASIVVLSNVASQRLFESYAEKGLAWALLREVVRGDGGGATRGRM